MKTRYIYLVTPIVDEAVPRRGMRTIRVLALDGASACRLAELARGFAVASVLAVRLRAEIQ